jgi:predicted nucleotidyltransferase
MDKAARRRTLERVVEALKNQLGDRLIGVFVHGSTARGEAGRTSDIDVWVATKPPLPDYETVPIGDAVLEVSYKTPDTALFELTTPSEEWAKRAARYVEPVVLLDSLAINRRTRVAYDGLDRTFFDECCRMSAVELSQHAAKAREALVRGDDLDVRYSGFCAALSVAALVATDHSTYLSSRRTTWHLEEHFPDVPSELIETITTVGTSVDCARIVGAVERMTEIADQIVTSRGIKTDDGTWLRTALGDDWE